MSVLSDYYAARAWLELNTPDANGLDRPVKTEKFTVLSENPFRAGLLVHNDASVVCYLKFGDEISPDEYSVALDPGQSYHLEDAGFFRCPHGQIVGLAEAPDDDGALQVTEWAHDSREMPNLRQLLRDIEEQV